jgi:hypothetical protein
MSYIFSLGLKRYIVYLKAGTVSRLGVKVSEDFGDLFPRKSITLHVRLFLK